MSGTADHDSSHGSSLIDPEKRTRNGQNGDGTEFVGETCSHTGRGQTSLQNGGGNPCLSPVVMLHRANLRFLTVQCGFLCAATEEALMTTLHRANPIPCTPRIVPGSLEVPAVPRRQEQLKSR